MNIKTNLTGGGGLPKGEKPGASEKLRGLRVYAAASLWGVRIRGKGGWKNRGAAAS